MAGNALAGLTLIGAGAAVGYAAFHPAMLAGLGSAASLVWGSLKFGNTLASEGSNNPIQKAYNTTQTTTVAIHNAAIQTVTGTPERCAKAGWKAWLDPYCVALKVAGQ